jgi:hypothetical protein
MSSDNIIQHYRNLVEEYKEKIKQITDPVYYNDLIKIIKTADEKVTTLSKEEIECRRRNRVTSMYTLTKDQVDELIETIDQYLFVAILNKQ